jgi:hypothetical protein
MVLPSQSLWNNGMVEQWNFEYSVAKADYGPILFSEPCHQIKTDIIPPNPSFHHSSIPSFHGIRIRHSQSSLIWSKAP